MRTPHTPLTLISVLFFMLPLVFSGTASAHKYASHSFDARVRGNQISMEFHLDTISTLEYIAENHSEVDRLDRTAALAYRQESYDHLNEQFQIANNGKPCTPSNMFNFQYVPKLDKFSFQYILTCPDPVETMEVDFKVFSEQEGMNTTVATFLSRSGGERYVFTRLSKATIRITDLVGKPREIKKLMRNYDPLKGFRAEADKLAALGIDPKAPAPVEAAPVSTPPPPPAAMQMAWSGFLGVALTPDAWLVVLLMGLGLATWRQRILGGALLAVAVGVGTLLGARGLVQIAAVVNWALLFGVAVALVLHIRLGKREQVHNRIALVAGLLLGVFVGSAIAMTPAITSAGMVAASIGGFVAALLLAASVIALDALGCRKVLWREGGLRRRLPFVVAGLSLLLLALRLYLGFA